MKVLQLDCKMQLLGRNALNQQHLAQCYVKGLVITSGTVLLVIG